ncbi:glutaredoxin family protein [Breznakiella homolactica]|uniref:Glutaredoxin domain-containing protein n=1 Tax=Breznakiella homolactica TaxID=2798577 RepID=A0A7T8B926_9SPIR|nr:anaerobic ribonucleoside-triphosphate reductase [Breznakiella homolactica]QQO07505.1 hypothetical protein JFL75_11095 [Breznakiella homolactica]
MRNLEVIKQELAAAREALSSAEGTPTEVYSRIVGYYRSVRNWNKGKREEYGERKLFTVPGGAFPLPGRERNEAPERASSFEDDTLSGVPVGAGGENRLMLFVRPACPACPAAKDAAGKLGIPVDMVNADTESGLAEAVRRNVLSTPTAILLGEDGRELARARNALDIASFASSLDTAAVPAGREAETALAI